MRNLPIPALNDKNIFSDIIKSKSGTYKKRLKRVRAKVRTRYIDYLSSANSLNLLPPSNIKGVYEDALIKCYSSRTKPVENLRGKLLYPEIEDFDECPYCGIGEPTTLDHYLPKEDFPEFSVLSKNLIPVCGVCNSNYKGSQWIENGERLFIHTYYDDFPQHTFLGANIIVGNKISLNFSAINIASHPDFSQLFSRHFDKLNLNQRYKRKATSVISRKRRRLEIIYRRRSSALDVANSLSQEATELKNELSGNHWKAALYDALSLSNDFCDGGFRKSVAK